MYQDRMVCQSVKADPHIFDIIGKTAGNVLIELVLSGDEDRG